MTETPYISFKEYLINERYITSQSIVLSMEMGSHTNLSFLQSLVDLGGIPEETLLTAIHHFSGISSYDPKSLPSSEIIKQFPKILAYQGPGFPISITETHVHFVLADPFDEDFQTIIRRFFKDKSIQFYCASAVTIFEILDKIYGNTQDFEAILSQFDDFFLRSQKINLQESPPTQFVEALLKQAILSNASDIHLEPEEHTLRIRLRIDGELHPLITTQKKYYAPILIRLKVIGRMNIAEGRLPQSSHLRQSILGKQVDFRLSTHPTLHGENMVIRVLDSKGSALTLDHLGFEESSLRQLKKLLNQQEGLIVVTGPTGSGKTTTLYAILRSMAHLQKNIMTLEQPIEYRLPFIRQTEIPENHEFLNFAAGIRSILRQDPDIILVGEIRDPETAAMAIRASMTGHLVLTTLHTHDALGAINRLQDLGVSAHHISDHLKGIIAQRLVRLICPECQAKGCEICQGIGFKGRQAMEEIITISPNLQTHIRENVSAVKLRKTIEEEGFESMKTKGLRLVDQGKTTLEELEKIISHDL